MPYKDREKRKAYQKKRYEEHKEEMKTQNKKWREEHKEERKAQSKRWREEHLDEHKAMQKKWEEEHKEERKAHRKTDAGKKTNRVSNWKCRGILSDDYDALYDKFLNTKNCEQCDCDLVEGNCKNARCLDHDHTTGLVRNILCRSCNSKRK